MTTQVTPPASGTPAAGTPPATPTPEPAAAGAQPDPGTAAGTGTLAEPEGTPDPAAATPEGQQPEGGEGTPEPKPQTDAEKLAALKADPLVQKLLADVSTKAAKKAVEDALKAEKDRIAEEERKAKMSEVDRLKEDKLKADAEKAAAESEKAEALFELEFFRALLSSGKQLVDDEDATNFLKQKVAKSLEEGKSMPEAVEEALSKASYLVRKTEEPVAAASGGKGEPKPKPRTQPQSPRGTESPSTPSPQKEVDAMQMTQEEFQRTLRERGLSVH